MIQCVTSRKSAPARSAAHNIARICMADCSAQNVDSSVPSVDAASHRACARRIAVAGSAHPATRFQRMLDRFFRPPICCGLKT